MARGRKPETERVNFFVFNGLPSSFNPRVMRSQVSHSRRCLKRHSWAHQIFTFMSDSVILIAGFRQSYVESISLHYPKLCGRDAALIIKPMATLRRSHVSIYFVSPKNYIVIAFYTATVFVSFICMSPIGGLYRSKQHSSVTFSPPWNSKMTIPSLNGVTDSLSRIFFSCDGLAICSRKRPEEFQECGV